LALYQLHYHGYFSWQAFSKDFSKVDLSRVLIEEIAEELPRKEDDYREIEAIAQALTRSGENPGVEKMIQSLEAGLRELIEMLEEQRLFVEQVSVLLPFFVTDKGVRVNQRLYFPLTSTYFPFPAPDLNLPACW
jgi:hypothetical protein